MLWVLAFKLVSFMATKLVSVARIFSILPTIKKYLELLVLPPVPFLALCRLCRGIGPRDH